MRRLGQSSLVFSATLSSVGLVACAASTKDGSGTSTVCVVRHAEAFKNLKPPPSGLTAKALDRLTDAGRSRAEDIARSLPGPVAVLMSSPLSRTRQTAAPIAETQGVELEVKDALAPLGGQGEEVAGDRIEALLTELRRRLDAGEIAVLVTHGDMGPRILGSLDGSGPAAGHKLKTGGVRCVSLSLLR